MAEPSRPSVRSLLFWLILGAQLLVPVLQFDETRPARFGWQMFSGVGPPIEFTVELADGTVETVDIYDHLARPRPEMDFASSLPPGLCDRIDAAEAIQVEVGGPAGSATEFECP